MARGLKVRQDDDDSSRGEGNDDNNSTEDGEGSSDDSTQTTSSRTTRSSDDNEGPPTTDSTPTPTPASANASPTGNRTPTPTSIDSSDVVSTKPGGQTVFITETAGKTRTITAPAQSANASSSSNNSTSGGLSTGAKAGIALGVIIPLALVTGLLFFLYRKRRKSQDHEDRSEVSEKRAEMAGASNAIDATSSDANAAPSGMQASQTLGLVGAAELHSTDKAVETGGQPVYEMPGSSPRDATNPAPMEVDAGPVSYEDVVAPPDYATLASPRDGADHVADGFRDGPGQDIVSPMGGTSETYAPGDVMISPLDSKIRH